MNTLRRHGKHRKHQSRFQKLWDRIERQREKNTRFERDLNALVEALNTRLLGAERECFEAARPLLQNLLRLGQRKSMANWQREELDSWIEELTERFAQLGLIDAELEEHLARYDAYRMGISLEDPDVPAARQLRAIIAAQRERQREEAEAMKAHTEEQLAKGREALHRAAREEVERKLDRRFGAEPPRAPAPGATADLWPQDLAEATAQAQAQWHAAREAAREQLLADELAQIDRTLERLRRELQAGLEHLDVLDEFDSDEEFARWAAGELDEDEEGDEREAPPADDSAPTITNAVFKRLFRATAQRLHPDREADPALHPLRAQQMRELLSARRRGDVIAVIAAWREHVGEDGQLNGADERQLVAALEAQAEQLAAHWQQLIKQSPHHQFAYENFWAGTRQQRTKLLDRHIAWVREHGRVHAEMGAQITALVRLKPHLEERYERRQRERCAGRHPLADLA